jgi:lipid-A-disaccharide synthase
MIELSAAQPLPRSGDLVVMLVACEESGDRLGADLMRALKERTGGAVRFAGAGGRDMAGEGVESLFPIDDLAIIGLGAIPRRLPTILRRIRETAEAIVATRPDVLVIIDSPDFTHRVARRVRAAAPSIPIVDYVSPSVWAWRPWRARAMRRYIDHVLALLPFEPAIYRQLGGPPCTYVGHPLVERVGELRPNQDEGSRRLSSPPVVVALPGSRSTEIRSLLPIFGGAIALARARHSPLEVVLPTLPHLVEQVEAATANWPLHPRIVVARDDKHAMFRIARAALAKSGTVTLELALSGVPMVAAYKVSLLEEIVARLAVSVHSVILANLVLGENVVPQYLQRACSPLNLADGLVPLLGDTPARRRQVDAFARLDEVMEIGQGVPSRRAADVVLKLAALSVPAEVR